ncbi:MAG TPA: ParB/RepB/Spo0J family partition protein [Vicinamibacteria bacterium]|jgi:ParB family chromosome partitioning protein|nr:ParB/RepB/Spo0J family partition protein [Vicinamibacteria bacterium]
MKRKALGKGLSALLPDPDSPPQGDLLEVSTDALDANPLQPRSRLAPERLAELAQSLKESGMIQPILVRRLGARFQIIAGERRWRAAQSLGLPSVPVTVRDVPDEKLLELALVENIQREELTCLEEAQAFQKLHDEFRLTQEEVARRVGKDRTTVANTLRLLRLPRDVRELLSEGRLDAGHGRALLALDRAEEQSALAREAAVKGLSVREVERRVASLRAPRTGKGKAKDANTRAAEERLRASLGTRVQIARKGKGGVLRVVFTSEAELNRLFELLLRAGRGRGA